MGLRRAVFGRAVDMLNGILVALIASGMEAELASVVARKDNRVAGNNSRSNSMSQMIDIISNLSQILIDVLKDDIKMLCLNGMLRGT